MPKTYNANCHCGLIKYTVTLKDALAPEGPGKINSCNCSICSTQGIHARPNSSGSPDSQGAVQATFWYTLCVQMLSSPTTLIPS